jgi:UTP-glucose-1-phosphate uridylyltransferase
MNTKIIGRGILKERILELNEHISKLENDNIALVDAIQEGRHKS